MKTPTKHVGEVDNQKVVIVFLQIPNREDHALVVDTNALPNEFHDVLMSLVESKEGQDTNNLADLLGRRIMPSRNTNVLTALHATNRMRAVPISRVNMMPFPNQTIPLVEVLKSMGKNVSASSVDDQKNFYESQQTAENTENGIAVAQNWIVQAQLLEDQAKEYRERAYRMAPTLRPMANVDEKIKEETILEKIKEIAPE